MNSRMKNPAVIIPEAMDAIKALIGSTYLGGLDPKLMQLVHLRVSQINGCGACIDGGWRHAAKLGESHERLHAIAGWRDTSYFTAGERAALALAESVTRLSDRADPVPDGIWNEAREHFDEKALAALILHIATTNVFNRLNVTTKQIAAGEWKA